MSGRWWRAYSRARHEPKLLKLSDKDFRWWFNLLCVASERGGKLPFIRDLAAEFRVSENVIAVAIERLRLAGLFEIEGEPGADVIYVPHNWNVLQYVSDSSSNRVKQFRERRRNVSETPSENRDREQSSEANASGAAAPGDPVKALFDEGVKLLGASGTPEKQARSLIGKWRGKHGNEATQTALNEAADCGITEPVAWIEARLGGSDRRTREIAEAIQRGLNS